LFICDSLKKYQLLLSQNNLIKEKIMANNNNKNEAFEKTLFKAADKLRKNMDAAEYKHIVLGLIFLKYISDSFEELYTKIKEGKGDFAGANPEIQIRGKSLQCDIA